MKESTRLQQINADVHNDMTFDAALAEITRLRATVAALLAACECEEIWHTHAHECYDFRPTRDQMEAVFRRHGCDEATAPYEFLGRLRREAIALAKGGPGS